jgi:ferredoxin
MAEKAADWAVHVAREACIRSAMCISLAPDIFHLAEDRAAVRRDRVAPDERVWEAAEFCPAAAISLTNAVTGLPVDDFTG